jgi:NADPH2:quinone reductase
MKALLCRAFGPEEGLEVADVDPPPLAAGQVRVKVEAAGLNFPDLLMIRGLYQFRPSLPFIPGAEGAGVVAELGEGVTGLAVGDRVVFKTPTGAFAEEAAVPAAATLRMPDAMSFEEGAGLTLVYGTSLHALKQRAALAAGETLLVLGAAGGVGLAAVELGKAMGARVIAAASSPAKLAAAKDHGADESIDYSAEDLTARAKALTGGKGVDVIYDPVGGAYTEAAFRAIAPGGRHLVVGFAAGDIPKLPLNLPLLKRASVVGVFWGAWAQSDPQGQAANMAELFALYARGAIRPHVAAAYALDDFRRAFEDISARRAIGKVVLAP